MYRRIFLNASAVEIYLHLQKHGDFYDKQIFTRLISLEKYFFLSQDAFPFLPL